MKLTRKLRTILKAIILPVVLVTLFIGAAYAQRQNADGGDNMALKGTIPSIDATAPTQVETATFSLG